MLLELIGAVAAVALLGAFLQLKIKHWRYSHIPGPKRDSFIFGNAKLVQASIKKEGVFGVYHLENCRRYGVFWADWMLHRPIVFIAEPFVIKELLTDFKNFIRPEPASNYLGIHQVGTARFCGHHSILTDAGGPIWRRKKRIMDPAFSMQKLTAHLPRFYEISKSVGDAMEATIQQSPSVDIRLLFQPFTIDAISSAGFSANAERQQQLNRGNTGLADAMTDIIGGAGIISMVLNSTKRQHLKAAMASLKHVRKVGKEMVLERTSDGTYGQVHDILDHVIAGNMDEENGSLDLEECLDDFMTMYAAGNATTLTTLSWSVAELVRNPVVMERLVEEVDSIWVGAAIDEYSDASQIGNTIKKMKYMEAFVKEVLRLHPPVVFNFRYTTSSNDICGYKVPAGTRTVTSQYVMQRWEKYWDLPDKFDPERFIDKAPKPYTYFPFFMGPRQCMGKNFAILELKTILCEIFKRFEVTKEPSMPEKIRSIQAFLCFPIDNMVILKPRY